MKEFRKRYIKKYLAEISKLLSSREADLAGKIDKLADTLNEARKKKNTVFLMGNGGSAATASHFAIDLAKLTIKKGKPRFRVVALTDSIPTMLAWANDASYDDIFIEQLKNLMQPGDVVIGISGSGNSKNVIKAIDYANANGGITVGLSGYDGGKLAQSVRISIHIPVNNMQQAEDMHVVVLHLLTSLIRDEK